MNDRIKELAKQAMIFSHENGGWRISTHVPNDFQEKFAELIIQDTIDLMRKEWYDLNNQPKVENESPRDIGLRVGRKSEIITLMEKIKNQYGVK